MYNFNTVRDHIDELGLEFGAFHRGTCPVCNRSNTFTATHTEAGIVFNCYSLGCNTTGVRPVMMDSSVIQDKIRERKRSEKAVVNRIHVPVGHDFEIPDRVVDTDNDPQFAKSTELFLNSWQIDQTFDDLYFKVMYDIRDNRVVFPVYGTGIYAHTVLDMVGRALDKTVSPKWLRYGATDQPFVYGIGRDCCVIVEDVISAIVAYQSTGVTGVALLGTQLTAEHKNFLGREFNSAVVALDRDAVQKQMAIASDLRDIMSDVKVCRLVDDVKYGNEADVLELTRLIKSIEKGN